MKLFKKCIFLLVIPFTATFPGCGPNGTDPNEAYYVLSWDPNWLVEKSTTEIVVKASYIAENVTETPQVEAGVILLDGDGLQGEFFPADTYGALSAGVAFETRLDGLIPETEYTLRTYVKADGKTHYGSTTRTATTDAEEQGDGYKISVSSPTTANLAYNSVRLSGSWSFTEGTPTVDEVGFLYRKENVDDWEALTSSGVNNPCYYTWTAANGGLEADTKYYIQFYVKIDGKVHKSSSATFTTPKAPDIPPPTGQAQWAELPVMKEVSGVWYVTHFVNSSGRAVAKPTDSGRVRNYTVAYDANDYKTLWVAAPMHDWYDGDAGRTDAWNYDPYIPQNVQPYLKSSYDAVGDGAFSRGHLVASSDRLRSSAMNTQTFYYTNMAPQHQTRFNDGIWNQLEQRVQGWGNAAADTVYVVTGLIYEGSKQTSDNTGRRLPVPSHFYKALISSKSGRTGKSIGQMSASELRCVGFLFENRAYTDGISSKFMVKVSDIESRVGYEFFPMLSESAKSVKSSYNASDWGM